MDAYLRVRECENASMYQKWNAGGHDGKAKTAATGALVLPYVNALLVCLVLGHTDNLEEAAVSAAYDTKPKSFCA